MVSIWAFLQAALSDTSEDAGTVFHSVVVFNQQSRHVSNSLHKDDSVMVAGELRFRTYVDKGSGRTHATRDVIADNVGASLEFADVAVSRAAKANGPDAEVSATGPVVAPVSYTDAGIAR